MIRKSLIAAGITLLTTFANALGGNPNVRFSPTHGSFDLANSSIWTDDADWAGVTRAAKDLQKDIAAVTGREPSIGQSNSTLLVGTIGRSPTIDHLIKEKKIDVSSVVGHWEACLTQVVDHPAPGIDRALVIAGADKRGAIYGLYDLSESIGVSPWYWWADVPIKRHPDLFVLPKPWIAKSPAVKYRGIFLNDEAPSLTGWATQMFGGYNHAFYEKVFELLLRLRANYLWPAMWNNCFSEDDSLNPVKADEYGIVMGTSHVEPMMRADKEWNRLGYTEKEWNYATHPAELEKFWSDGLIRNKPYENVVTIAMRGKIDTPMSESANIELLEKIVAAQRKLIARDINPDVAKVPQLWCLYKEVQEYYEKGMRVPDDVTLLWADDNWGNIRRLPTPSERNRPGGAGVYYHFDYVGGPRNYKWIDTNPLPKIWEQMNLAYQTGADRIWIVNVGDLKPMEYPLEFFLTFARDPNAIPKEKLDAYAVDWSSREFGPELGPKIADVVSQTHRLAGRRKPELLEPGTYSLTNYQEADRVLSEFKEVADKAEAIERRIPPEAQSAYFQLVLHPVKANQIVNQLYVAAARNALYAKQGRAAANEEAQKVRDLFAADAELTARYHSINRGKWNHMMDQTHIGYTGWQQPDKNVMPTVTELTIPDPAEMGVAIDEDSTARNLTFTQYGRQTRTVQIFNRGKTPFSFQAHSDQSWIRLSRTNGEIDLQDEIVVSIDWSRAPTKGQITISGAGKTETLHVEARKWDQTPKGFAEGDGVVAIEAEHFSRQSQAEGSWQKIPGYGPTLSGIAPYPTTFDPEHGPQVEYDFTTFTPGKAKLAATFGPSLAGGPHGLRVAISFDDGEPHVENIATEYLSRSWEKAVSDNAVTIEIPVDLNPGRHTLKVRAIDPGVVLERLVIDLGGLKAGYLGPPESKHFP